MRKSRRIYLICILSLLLVCCTGCGKDKKKQDIGASTEEIPTEAVVTTEEPKPEMDEAGFFLADDYVQVTDELADVRVKAEDSAAIYMLADRGTFLNRTGYNDVWTRVELENTSFYVLSSSVIEAEPPKQEGAETATDGDAASGMQLVKKVVIDPANQAVSNAGTEEIGPRSGETKASVSTGTVGTTFGTKESELNLEYAKLLKTELESRGYEVVLTREENDVNLSNKERADIANNSGASVFIRIQMNESSNAELNGVMSVCMTAESPYNSDLYADSKTLAVRLLQGVTAATGATNRGVVETDQMTAINWSEIPVAAVNLGFLTNPTDEGNLISETYKSNMVKGLADGIDYFFQ